MAFVINGLYLLLLAFWWGAMAYFTFVATPVIFAQSTPDVAAATVGKLFPGFFGMGTWAGAGLVIIGGIRLLMYPGSEGKAWVRWGLILVSVMFALNLVNHFYILPDMQHIQSQIPTFEGPKEGNPLRLEFGRYHGISMALNLTNILLGAVTLGLFAKSADRSKFI